MDDLTTLLHDAVEDVEPTDRLGAIREQVRPRRRGWYAAGGAALAAAAAVTAIALGGNQNQQKADDPPVTSPSPDASPTELDSAYPVYYLGETPAGPRLYREFQRAPGDRWTEVAIQLLTQAPHDPDYRTPWPPGAFETAKLSDTTGSEVIEVTLRDGTLRKRPAGMSATEAELAVQQVVYTLQGTVGERHPVQFRWNGNPIDQVLGVATSEPIVNAPILDVSSLVHLNTPDEGQVLPVDGTLHVSGEANSFEANLVWTLQRWEGTEIVGQGHFTAAGAMEERLFPFEGDVDLAGIPAGRYLLSVATDDPSGGAEGPGPHIDTRLITIQ